MGHTTVLRYCAACHHRHKVEATMLKNLLKDIKFEYRTNDKAPSILSHGQIFSLWTSWKQ